MTDFVRRDDDWDAVARRLWPVRDWLSRHPRIVDVVVVLVCLGLQGLAVSLSGAHANGLVWVPVGLGSAALWWRRRAPFLTLLIVVALATVTMTLLPTVVGWSLPASFALYAVASVQGLGRALLGYAVAVLVPIGAALAQSLNAASAFSPALLDPMAVIALALGIAVRSWRQRNDTLQALWDERSERARITERAAIAADMHDVVAHSLSTMIALANGAASGWEKHPERSARAVRNVSAVGRTALLDMSRILHLLPEHDGEQTGAGTAPQSLTDLVEIFRSAGLPVELVRRGADEVADDPTLQMTVYRIVQESLTNVLRYGADATRVEVLIASEPATTTISVTDDSLTAAGPSVGTGRGLLGIAARADAYDGTSAAGPLPSGGWRTFVTLHPQPASQEGGDRS